MPCDHCIYAANIYLFKVTVETLEKSFKLCSKLKITLLLALNRQIYTGYLNCTRTASRGYGKFFVYIKREGKCRIILDSSEWYFFSPNLKVTSHPSPTLHLEPIKFRTQFPS